MRSGPPTTSHGKFLVLKPTREEGVPSTSKDVSSPTDNVSNWVISIQFGVAHSFALAPSISPNYPKLSTMERKAATLSLNSGPIAEKRSSSSQAQGRHDFLFNSIASNGGNICEEVESPTVGKKHLRTNVSILSKWGKEELHEKTLTAWCTICLITFGPRATFGFIIFDFENDPPSPIL